MQTGLFLKPEREASAFKGTCLCEDLASNTEAFVGPAPSKKALACWSQLVVNPSCRRSKYVCFPVCSHCSSLDIFSLRCDSLLCDCFEKPNDCIRQLKEMTCSPDLLKAGWYLRLSLHLKITHRETEGKNLHTTANNCSSLQLSSSSLLLSYWSHSPLPASTSSAEALAAASNSKFHCDPIWGRLSHSLCHISPSLLLAWL